jgi:hypothetical protein
MAKEKFLDNRIAPRKKDSGNFPWDFKAPSYDNRSSCSIAAGNDYGIGFTQPIGSMKCKSVESGPIPQKMATYSAERLIARKDIEG